MSNNIIDSINADIQAIKRYDKDICKTYFFIARRLYELKESGYVEQSDFKGYKNIYDLALNEFGYEAAKVKYLIAIYLRFFNTDDEVTRNNVTHKGKKNDYKDFSISQLRFMCEMTEEQLKKCTPEMSVKEIKEIKTNFDSQNKATRVATFNVENLTNLKNEISGQNVITGVFPDKTEEKTEEKQETIIVSALPCQPEIKPKETKIVVEVKQQPELNFDFIADDSDSVIQKYEITIESLKVERDNLHKERAFFKKESTERYDMLLYIRNELETLKLKSTDKLIDEIKHFCIDGSLPKKLDFMKNVI